MLVVNFCWAFALVIMTCNPGARRFGKLWGAARDPSGSSILARSTESRWKWPQRPSQRRHLYISAVNLWLSCRDTSRFQGRARFFRDGASVFGWSMRRTNAQMLREGRRGSCRRRPSPQEETTKKQTPGGHQPGQNCGHHGGKVASSRKHERVFRPISVAEWAGEARKLCFLLASSSANCSSRFSERQTHCDQPCPYFSGHGKKKINCFGWRFTLNQNICWSSLATSGAK